MPRVIPQRKWKPDELVVAWTSVATGDHVVLKGQKLRGDHPVVKACPRYFVPDGTADDEMPTDFDLVPEAPEHAPTITVAPTIPDREAAVCHTRFYVMATGRLVGKGAVLRLDDPLVREHPEYFRTAGVTP